MRQHRLIELVPVSIVTDSANVSPSGAQIPQLCASRCQKVRLTGLRNASTGLEQSVVLQSNVERTCSSGACTISNIGLIRLEVAAGALLA